jgi:hypothetical protein
MQNHLRSYVIWSSAKSFRRFISLNVLLAHTKIGDLNVSVLIQQNIIQLQIAINNSARVKEEQTDGDFSRIKPKPETCRNKKNETETENQHFLRMSQNANIGH